MENSARYAFAVNTALFRGCAESTVKSALSSPRFSVKECARGERVSFQNGALGIVVKGKLKVGGRVNRRKLIINTLEKGSILGFASLFEENGHFETDVFSAGATTLFIFSGELVTELIERDPVFAKNIIAMQAEKIRFLNRKILSFTAPSASEKLLRYLEGLEKDPIGNVRLPMGIAPLAARLDVGRATLYRALKKLEVQRKIKINGDSITVLEENP